MGVLNKTPRRCLYTSDSDDPILDEIDTEPEGEDGRHVSVPQPVQPFRKRNRPAASRNDSGRGFKLTLKKGKRSRQRCDNERSLMMNAGLDPDGAEADFAGWDIAQQSRSHFRSLLSKSNSLLLEDFLTIDQTDQESMGTLDVGDKKTPASQQQPASPAACPKSPDEAYRSISSHLRAALKRHLPRGIMETVDQDILYFFTQSPQDAYVACHLTSYERLLAHACSMYYQLRSQSYDTDQGRILKIENPRVGFCKVDPCLSQYLKNRNMM